VATTIEIKRGDGCWGHILVNGRTLGLCITCTRLGGRELTPVATVELGHAQCVNFLPLAQGALRSVATGQGG
jgi:hypothetical protein